jgi:hypothetical protein
MIKGYMNASGGGLYHAKAIVYQHTLWRDYTENIKHIITNWLDGLPPSDSLILVGHSGGYSLPLQKIKNYRLICIDPDPLAHRILNFRLSGKFSARANDKHIRNDLIIRPILEADPTTDSLVAILKVKLSSPVIFCNFWGQVGVLTSKADQVFNFWKHNLPVLLEGRPWLSYHDRLSTQNLNPTDKKIELSETVLSNDQLIKDFFIPNNGEVVDHKTHGFFSDVKNMKKNYTYLQWTLSYESKHIIEVCSS